MADYSIDNSYASIIYDYSLFGGALFSYHLTATAWSVAHPAFYIGADF